MAVSSSDDCGSSSSSSSSWMSALALKAMGLRASTWAPCGVLGVNAGREEAGEGLAERWEALRESLDSGLHVANCSTGPAVDLQRR